jgi:ribosomal protein L29
MLCTEKEWEERELRKMLIESRKRLHEALKNQLFAVRYKEDDGLEVYIKTFTP